MARTSRRQALTLLTFGSVLLLAIPALAAGTTHRIAMESVDYAPKHVDVRVGDTVEWINKDIVAHTATAKDRSWEVNVLPGKTGRLVMKVPGTLTYFCRYHPNMIGEIVVRP